MGKKVRRFFSLLADNFGRIGSVYGSIPSGLYGAIDANPIHIPEMPPQIKIKSNAEALKNDFKAISVDLKKVVSNNPPQKLQAR